MTTRPVFVLDHTAKVGGDPIPADVGVVAWTDICHGQRGKDFLFISHDPSRSPSRWTYAENKRPFIVYTRHWFKLGASSTLAGALKIAKREA
jgi:hypothetical protein